MSIPSEVLLLQSQVIQTNSSSALVTAVALALAVIAIARSPRKWQTLLFVVGWALLFSAVGIAIGFAFGSAPAAGTLGALALQVGLAGAAIEQIYRYRRSSPPPK